MQTICVYCGSSTQVDETYFRAAEELGGLLAAGGHTLVYGGGSLGLMGALAQSVLRGGGRLHHVGDDADITGRTCQPVEKELE